MPALARQRRPLRSSHSRIPTGTSAPGTLEPGAFRREDPFGRCRQVGNGVRSRSRGRRCDHAGSGDAGAESDRCERLLATPLIVNARREPHAGGAYLTEPDRHREAASRRRSAGCRAIGLNQTESPRVDSNQLLQERIQKMHAAIARVTGAELPSPLREQLDAASLAVGELDSDAPLEHLVARIDGPDWRLRLGEHLGHALEGLAVANYHIERVAEIEVDIGAVIQSLDDPPPSTSTGFRSRKLDAEYQAFVFALRRAIEYFAAAVAAYFKTDCSRIRKVGAAIEGREPREQCLAAAAAIQEGVDQLPNVPDSGKCTVGPRPHGPLGICCCRLLAGCLG